MASWTLKDLNKWKDLSIIPNVIKLDISSENLIHIPLKVFKLINLQEFNCYFNKIKKLPKEIGQLINLQRFNCCNNKLTYLPKEIGQLINLQIFYCPYNKLKKIYQKK
jgi:Leucine-rich repeat (LRR) protein